METGGRGQAAEEKRGSQGKKKKSRAELKRKIEEIEQAYKLAKKEKRMLLERRPRSSG
jgi:hypothetical protein